LDARIRAFNPGKATTISRNRLTTFRATEATAERDGPSRVYESNSKGVAKLRKTKPDIANSLAAATAAIFDAFEGRILLVDRLVATAWGEALGVSERHIDDAGIAATAKIHGLVVVTRNIKDFANRGVSLLDPFELRPRRSR
jgi:hypothetical protein